MLDPYLPLARRLLHEDDLAQQIAPDNLQALLDAGSIERHRTGQVLSQRGEQMTELLFILEGSVEVSIDGGDGRRSICWYLAAGQWLGLIAVLDGKAAIHNLRVHTSAVVLHIPCAAFQRILHRDHKLTLMCLNVLCERSRSIYDNLAAENLLPLRARVARLLLMLIEQHGRDGQRGVELALKLSQEDFADMLGVTRQSLNRELKALEKSSIISLAYSRITLRDLTALQDLACANKEGSSSHFTPVV